MLLTPVHSIIDGNSAETLLRVEKMSGMTSHFVTPIE